MELVLEVLLAPFVACLVLTGIHTYLGLHVVSRGVIFVDLALAQIAALGATFAFLLGYDPHSTGGYLYSLLFAFGGAAIFSISRLKEQRIPQEAIIGISFAVASAMAILIADRAPEGSEVIEAMLKGVLLWVPWSTIVKTAVIYSLVGLFHWIYRRRFLTISLEPEKAEAQGWNVRWWDFLFYTSFGFVITSSVAMAGVLLVFSFLVIPSVIAMLFSRSIVGRLTIGWSVGTVVSMVGLSLSYTCDFPSGPAVVGTFGGALILAGIVRYLFRAERPAWAAAKVATAALLLVAGLWAAHATAPAPESIEEEVPAAQISSSAPANEMDPTTRARQALARLEEAQASGNPPPADAIGALGIVHEELHQLMLTGEVKVTEAAVEALDKASGDGVVTDLLEEIAYHAEDPWVKLRGAEALVRRKSPLGIEALVELLEGDAPTLLQVKAAEALEGAAGMQIDFDPQADEETKKRAVARWRVWWNAHRGMPPRDRPTSTPKGQ